MSLSELAALSRWLENREPLLEEFRTLVIRSHKEPWPAFEVDGCEYDLKRGWLKPKYSGVPTGSHNAGGGDGPDRPSVVELAARIIAVRSRRWYPITRTVKPIPPTWDGLAREAFPFLPVMEIGDGWSDLMIAMAGWMSELGLPQGYRIVQIKEKMGSLRWYDNSGHDGIDDIVEAVEHLSHVICDQCGAPGKTRDGGWIVTRCDEHA